MRWQAAGMAVAFTMVAGMMVLAYGTPAGAERAGGATGGAGVELLPDLVTLQPADVYIEQRNGERLLRFRNDVANKDSGVLEIMATDEEVDCLGDGVIDNDRVVYQRIYLDASGTGYFVRDMDTEYREVEVGCIYWHEAHRHWHFSGFALYELHDESGPVVEGQKVSFCLTDTYRAFNSPGAPSDKHFETSCDEATDVQGISLGWVDRYAADLDHQYLVIDGVPDGDYCLVSTANPEGRLLESDATNNSASLRIRLAGDDVETFPGRACPGQDAPDPGPRPDTTSPVIYDDTLHWSNWSWNTAIERHVADPVYEGIWSLGVAYQAPWTGLSLHGRSFDTRGYSHLQFALHPGDGSFPVIDVLLVLPDESETRSVRASDYAQPADQGWYLVGIPLAAFELADASIAQVRMQEAAGTTPPAMYLDSIAFVRAPGTDDGTAGGNPAPTPPPSPASESPTPVPSNPPETTPPPASPSPADPAAPAPEPSMAPDGPGGAGGNLVLIFLATGLGAAGGGVAALLMRRHS